MTYQSYTWALEQDVPGDAWRVLLAIANRTEHRTGRVYFDAEEIIHESKIVASALPRYVGALRRNGYIAIDTKGKDKHYWLALDRDPAKEFSWDAAESATESDEAPASGLAPTSSPARFQKAAQAEQRKEIEKPTPGVPVDMHPIVTGSKLDEEWTRWFRANRKTRPFEMNIILKGGAIARGYYMPSAMPPREQEQIAV